MIVKLCLFFVVVVASSRAMQNLDLKSEIEESQQQIRNMSQKSISEVEEVIRKITENTEFFSVSVKTYLSTSAEIIDKTEREAIALKKKFTGEAIDNNKPINSFKCLLRVEKETAAKITDAGNATTKCIINVKNAKENDLQGLKEQLRSIQNVTQGLYDVIIDGLEKCTSTKEVQELVHKGQLRQNSLVKVVQKYTTANSDLRIEYNQGQLSCLNAARTNTDNIIKSCTNSMKVC